MAANIILPQSIYLKESRMQAAPRSALFALSLILAFSLQAKEATPAVAAKMGVDQIIAKYQEARGGADKWAAAKTMKADGSPYQHGIQAAENDAYGICYSRNDGHSRI
jgi:hypothetical protein